jgi:hypothetical protein
LDQAGADFAVKPSIRPARRLSRRKSERVGNPLQDGILPHSLRDFPQFRHSTDFHPLHDEYVPGMIETRAVRANEFAGDELVARLLAQFAPGV